MRKISLDEAATRHGITTCHQEMDNGEFRFRLRKSDGTAYIRTESSKQGEWQSSHYHSYARETYVVQNGWIAYAALIDGQTKISVFRAGGLFTTQPGIVHNIYMSANSAIHTIKHGEVSGEDRLTNETTRQFDLATKSLTEGQINRASENDCNIPTNERLPEKYTAEYRHFDTLIWQLPAWCTAIFLVTAVGFNSISNAKLLTGTGISTDAIVTSFLALMCMVIMILSHVLYRFRMHQAPLKTYSATPIWSSASAQLQLVVSMEGFALLFLLLLLNGVPFRWTLAGCVLGIASLTWYRESKLRRVRGGGNLSLSGTPRSLTTHSR